jgi:integrase
MPVLTADEARTFLDSIPIRKATDQNGVIVEKPDLMGLRDRALIGLMAYSFARIGAALQMKVADISCRNAGDACASMRRAVERSPPTWLRAQHQSKNFVSPIRLRTRNILISCSGPRT